MLYTSKFDFVPFVALHPREMEEYLLPEIAGREYSTVLLYYTTRRVRRAPPERGEYRRLWLVRRPDEPLDDVARSGWFAKLAPRLAWQHPGGQLLRFDLYPTASVRPAESSVAPRRRGSRTSKPRLRHRLGASSSNRISSAIWVAFASLVAMRSEPAPATSVLDTVKIVALARPGSAATASTTMGVRAAGPSANARGAEESRASSGA